MWHVWRLVLLVGGAVLLVWALDNVTRGVTTWPVFAVGAVAGAGIAVVAFSRSWLVRRGAGRTSRPADDNPMVAQLFAVAVGVALVTVVGLLGRYGAAVGTFSVITGVVVLERFRRDWRQVRARSRPPRT